VLFRADIPATDAAAQPRTATLPQQQQPQQSLPQQEDSYASLFATGSSVYWHSVQVADAPAPLVGKEALMIPARLAAAPAVRLDALRHAGEVQGLAVRQLAGGELVLATVDSYGLGTLSRITVDALAAAPAAAATVGGGDEQQQQQQQQHRHPAAAEATVQGVEALQPHNPLREGGWAGAAFSHAHPSMLACARSCARDITLFDGAVRQRTLHTVTQPYALAFLGEGHDCSGGGDVLAATEGHVVSDTIVRVVGLMGVLLLGER